MLLLAVLVLVLLAILGATFVALLAHNVYQTARMGDVAVAKEAADQGVLYIHRKMLASSDGADWRLPVPDTDGDPTNGVQLPPDYYTPEEISRGYGTDPVTAASLSPAEFGSRFFIKIDNPAEAGDAPFLQNTPGSQLRGRTMVKLEYAPSVFNPTTNAYDFPVVSDPSIGGTRYDELSPFIKITCVGTSSNAPGLFRSAVAYVPLLLPDRMFNIVDDRGTGAVQPFGAPSAIDLDGDGSTVTDPVEAVTFGVNGGLFANTPVHFYGTDLFTVDPPPGSGFPMRGDRVMIAGHMSFAGTDVRIVRPGDPLSPYVGQTSRLPGTSIPRPTGFGPTDFVTGGEDLNGNGILDLGEDVNGNGVLDGPAYLDNMGLLEPSADPGGYRAVARINGPRLDATDPGSNEPMLARAARESGQWFINNNGTPLDTSDDTVENTGLFGFGRAIYVNNSGDIQTPHLEGLVNNWRRVDAASEAYWYGPLYTPPGAGVIFYNDDQRLDNSRFYLNDQTKPDIQIVLHADAFGRVPTFRVPVDDTGDTNGNGMLDQGEVANLVNPTRLLDLDVDPDDGIPDSHVFLDYPENGVLYFTGNVRVSGRLAQAFTEDANGNGVLDPGEDDPVNPNNVLDKWGDVTLVSRGNIYIEGNILRPRDLDDTVPDVVSSRLALLAEGSVVVNGTRSVLRGIQTNGDFIPDTPGFRSRGHWRLNQGQSFATFIGFGGTAAEDQGLNPADIYLKLRVRGSPLSPFILRINAVRYDFDPEAAGVNPCTQMSGEVETLYIPLVDPDTVPGAPYVVDFNNDGTNDLLDLSGGGLNVIQIYPATTATRPLELFAVGLDRRVGSDSPILSGNYDPSLGPAPLVAPDDLATLDPVILRPALDMVVSAMCYAQHGTWFVLPGDYWDRQAVARDVNGDGVINATLATTDDPPIGNGNGYLDPEDALFDVNGDAVLDPPDVDANGNGVADWAENRRQNVRITVNGAISESVIADIFSVTDWMDKFSYSTGDGTTFGQVVYNYDPGLRSNRLFGAYVNLPRLPRLPVSNSVIYFGTIL